MRCLVLLAVLCGLVACGNRRTFDERYNDTSAELEQRARDLDRNLADEGPANEVNGNQPG